jgi:tetratricopeptide (TPR) repeat protein
MMQTETNRDGSFVRSRLPWAMTAGMLVIYLFTIHRWLTPASLFAVTKISGLDWQPTMNRPALFLVTYPFHWLPAGILPLALNLFSAVCGALSLGLLARSVALLPHDRTYEQRQREQSEFALLSIRTAWLPPVMAVLVCGLQMTFWENAIDATGEMFDLLIFAYVIRCLLEYRVSREDSWLTRFALVYGLGMAENWAMVGFFPAFLAALVWIKGLSFFNGRFLMRTTLLGLLGLALILFLPAVNGIQFRALGSFWQYLGGFLHSYTVPLLHAFPRNLLILLSLTSVVPILLIGIRWASHFGDTSPLGIFLATFTFHTVHLLFLLACLWMALDSPLSPRMQDPRVPFLTLYYLGALSVGYFCGYFLLIFGVEPGKSRRRPNPFVIWMNRGVTACVWVLFLTVPLVLAAKNLPQLQRAKAIASTMEKYCAEVRAALPDHPVVVLSDDPFHLLYVQASLTRSGRDGGNLYIYTDSFAKVPTYLRYLAKKFPQFDLGRFMTNSPTVPPGYFNVVLWLNALQQAHELYYLQPSFGFFSEEFCRQPRGIVYQFAHYPSNEWNVPLPTAGQIEENQQFWKRAANEVFPVLTNALSPAGIPANPNWRQKLLAGLHLTDRPDFSALGIANYYSRAINYWGVELQRCGRLGEARTCFEQALQLNPNNVVAKSNLEFNQDLRDGKKIALHMVKEVEDKFGQYGNWDQVMNSDGPFDDPSFHLHLGTTFTYQGNFRQAEQEISRTSELVPDSAMPLIRLAQLFLYIPNSPTYHLAPSLPVSECYSNALVASERGLKIEPENRYGLFFKGMALMQIEDFASAVPVLTELLNIQTNNYSAMLDRAIANLRLNRLEASKQDYEKVAAAYTNAYQAYYGLGEIAYRRKDTPDAIKNYELYLTNAPPRTLEYSNTQTRLNELKSSAH